MQLEEYQLFKEAGGNLQKFENVNRFYKQPDKKVGDARIVFNQFNYISKHLYIFLQNIF